METENNEVTIILKRIRYFLACCNSHIIVGNTQFDKKPPENEQGGATKKFKKLLKSYTVI